MSTDESASTTTTASKTATRMRWERLRGWLSRRGFLGTAVAAVAVAGGGLAAALRRRRAPIFQPERDGDDVAGEGDVLAARSGAGTPAYRIHPLPDDLRLREQVVDLERDDSDHLAG